MLLTWRLVPAVNFVLGACCAESVPGRVFRKAAAWKPAWRPTLLIELELNSLFALHMASCPQTVIVCVGMGMLMLTVTVETSKTKSQMQR